MKELTDLNKKLRASGMNELAIVSPHDCISAPLNARYLPVDKKIQFVENVKRDKRLESVPLVWRDPSLPEGKYRIISGHQRIDVAKEAGVEQILVMIATPINEEDAASKLLAHNALTGQDDAVILKEIFDSIKDITLRLATGLTDEISKINYTSINFRAGNFKEFTVAFLPTDIQEYDEAMEKIANSLAAKGSTTLRVTSMEYWEEWKKAIIRVKKTENIKSNGTAISRLIELALERLKQIQDEV